MTPARLADLSRDLLADATAIAREIARAHLASPTPEIARAKGGAS